MNIPVTIYAEMTPNPASMKFVANKHILIDKTVNFGSQAEARGYSPLAEELFNFPFVKGVFISANFVTINKTESLSWDFVLMELREFLKAWLSEGKDVLIRMPEEKPVESKSHVADAPKKVYAPSEFDQAIVDLLDEYIRPAVEGDGGAIDFRSFEDGVVTVLLKGACAGCPSSTATLKGGIENLLKQYIPEITSVVAENE
jgi:NFU1 iron-sulfur cluster scaffold homolog, mitochondrial